MQRAYKVELKPTNQQIQKINQCLGVCRWLYNAYLAKNQSLYQDFKEGKLNKKKAFMSANDFDKYINNDIKVLDDCKWINDCGSKARKKAICNAEFAYKKFFKGEAQFPRFKKKGKSKVGLYFPRNNKTDFKIERHKINIPTLKWVRLKEFGYIKANANVISGTVTEQAGKYYISIVCEIEEVKNSLPKTEPLGLDLGIKDFAIFSNEVVKKNINKTSRVKKLEKKLKREQVRLSRKYECLKKQNKIRKGEATRQNIRKQIVKVQRLHQRLANIRTDYINKCVSEIVGQKPSSITIEDLNVKGMMKNRHLSKAVAGQKFYEFRIKLTNKCKQNDIELRIVDRWYPSSKLCSCCGNVKKDLKLSDRIYVCKECGLVIDRDLQASINLREAKTYKIA
ncbi:transposase, IS605 OrfB family [Lachnoclostridium phytofermentans ISDg]|uniref:Transposase, IS605 OrfB family n=1 Tax=Lachnoclostridium phytofermentans (strain ATCC 700394 / DSM 18823 / ISDg) TaxID=357809 RepID=A9KQW2_LACP7|nr:transposase, IS605 OrfB family [Lachnoclostridium phytofermentans ISDg]